MSVSRVIAVTLNLNGAKDTIECVAALRRSTYRSLDIVVVDNGSTDDSVATLRAQCPDVTLIVTGRNLGYGAGYNVGLEHAYAAGADYFLVLNSDTIIDPHAVEALVEVAERREKVGFVSGKVYHYSRPDTFQTVGRYSDPRYVIGSLVGLGEVDHGQYDQERQYDFVDDVFRLVSRPAYEATGGYDPTYFLYYEETDWCARVRRAGFTIWYTPHARIWHKGRTGGSDLEMAPLRHYYMARNHILFMRRNATPEQFRRFWLRFAGDQTFLIARLVRHGKFSRAWARLRGIGAGLVWLASQGRG